MEIELTTNLLAESTLKVTYMLKLCSLVVITEDNRKSKSHGTW